MTNSQPYTYVESDSALYGPDGTFLKEVYCPKAVDWNQLIADDPRDRSRGCALCRDRVINLDLVDVNEVVEIIKRNSRTCVFGSEKSVRFLHDVNKPESPSACDGQGTPIIRTARTVLDIKRGAVAGFWPDVRLVEYDTQRIGSKFRVLQHEKSGHIRIQSDFRSAPRNRTMEGWNIVIDFTSYYQYHQRIPLAAYLVPKDLLPGSNVIVADPIEDIVGSKWNQGDSDRAQNIKGVWDGTKIIVDRDSFCFSFVIG